MHVERVDLSEWGDILPSDGYEVFHRPEALRVLDNYAAGDLILYAGYKGEQRVAMLPIFVRERAVGTAVLSPEPSMSVPRLGPLLSPVSPKQRKREKLNQTFVEEVLDTLLADTTPALLRIVCSVDYDDPRPFRWHDLNVSPRFTYHLEVGDDQDAQLQSFSKSLRREVRNAEDLDMTVQVEGEEGARRIYEATMARYEQQDDGYRLPWAYVRDLFNELDERSRAYVARDPQGEFLGGVTVLYSNDMAYFWQGGMRASYENVSVNSPLHWRVIQDIAAGDPIDSVSTYDLMGANTERLCQYKAKFGGQLVPYFTVESDGKIMDLAKGVYQAFAH